MFSGKLVTNGHNYEIQGYDTSESFCFYITAHNYKDLAYMASSDEGYDEPDLLWERACEIKMTRITVQTGVSKNEAGKTVKSPVNPDLFCRLAALIRYAKINCKASNAEGYSALELASGEFVAEPRKTYIIPYPVAQETNFARVTLDFGNIVSLHLEGGGFILNLTEDIGERLFVRPKDGWSSGFRLDSEYLGFEVPMRKVTVTGRNDGLFHTLEEIQEAHPEKDFSWLLEKDYCIVNDDTLEQTCQYLATEGKYLYFDTETTGLNINFLSRIGQADQCVGIILSVKYGESFFFPLQMNYISNLCNGDHFYVMEHYIRPLLEGRPVVVHNASFDWKVGYIYDINTNIVHDTMAIIALTLGAEIKNYSIGLKENTKILLGRDALELSDMIVDGDWGDNDIKFWDLPEELVRLYACADTDDTMGLLQYAEQNDILGRYGASRVYEIEVAFAVAVGYQEFYGHHINVANVDSLRETLYKEQEELMGKMVKMVGHDFNPNSSPQLLNIMYRELGIPEQISRKTGRPTTDKETLAKLAEITDAEDNVKYPFVKLLLEFRQYEGVRKIVDKFPEHMTSDGYIFSSVMQYGTTTGRVSINNPNYQSYNDPVKKNVVPRPGFYMTDTDYSSVEYRVLANMVGNEHIKSEFVDPDFDYHTYQAAHMYNVPYSAVTKKLRKAAKGINFGLPYGMGDESLGVRIFGEASEENTRKAVKLRAAYFKGQEDIRDWFEHHRDKGVNLGYTETYFGRRRYYRKSDFTVSAIRRQAGNQVIQGCQSLETRILTKEFGIVQLGDVLGLNVTVWNGVDWTNGDVLDAGMKRKTIIRFKGGQTMVCSPNHKFLVSTKRGGTMWVEAQNLHTTSEYRNPHRIVVNQNYEDGNYTYRCDDVEYSKAHNANNVCLSDIGESYKIGLFLGRLAADGHQTLNNTGSNALVQIVAEHEFDILPALRECMENLNYVEKIDTLRENRNERLARLTVYSTSLSREVDELDIRHKIHKNIFMDTEVLRGFLCGYFDGDGGVSGKTITCIFGKQDNFRVLVEDMQKALMFFGVRSRIREYDDRYVLQIKTNDNPVFLYNIGFMNPDKLEKGFQLECIEEEATFGKCIIAESVEVTDEYIPMADVCNTDGGFYVADGIIVHNTAADIYKTAVGRVFKRICREGWLGKVLIPGFIHDELLCEVSNDINPGIFLKVLREEFEVKVFNDDGSPWCPLYMGFGYGMSWYEAKSVELPIQLQWKLVDQYGVDGFPNWDGDGRKFCDTIPDMLRAFEVEHITEQIQSPEAQGKEIKPALNSALLDCIKEDAKCYGEGLSEFMQEDFNEVNEMGVDQYIDLNEGACKRYLDEHYHIQNVLRDDEGKVICEFKATKETQPALDLFCKLHVVDRSMVNLLNIEEAGEPSGLPDSDDDVEEGGESYVGGAERLKDVRIDTLGMYLDPANKEVTFLYVPEPWIGFIQGKSNHEGKGYLIYFKDSLGIINKDAVGGVYKTKAYITSENVNSVQEMYLQYFKAGK